MPVVSLIHISHPTLAELIDNFESVGYDVTTLEGNAAPFYVAGAGS